jgi:hypothetical protein
MAARTRHWWVGIMGSGHIRFGHGVPHQLGYLGVAKASLLPVALDGECRHLESSLNGRGSPCRTRPCRPANRRASAWRWRIRPRDDHRRHPRQPGRENRCAPATALSILPAARASGSEAVATIRRQPRHLAALARGDSQLDLVVQFPPRRGSLVSAGFAGLLGLLLAAASAFAAPICCSMSRSTRNPGNQGRSRIAAGRPQLPLPAP